MKYVNIQPLIAADITATVHGAAEDACCLVAASVQAVVTGTAGGTLSLEYSNDINAPGNPTNWSTVPNATVSVSNDGVYAIGKSDLSYRWIRVTYTKSSSTGSPVLTANLMALGF